MAVINIFSEKFQEIFRNGNLEIINPQTTGEELFTKLHANRILLQNNQGNIISIYKRLVTKVDTTKISTDETLKNIQDSICTNKKWAIFLLKDDRFSGAVFNGNDITVHRSLNLNVSNLKTLNKDDVIIFLREKFTEWTRKVEECSLFFYGTPKKVNYMILFSALSKIIARKDRRVRKLPFSFESASFNEVAKIQSKLTEATLYYNLESEIKKLPANRPSASSSHQARQRINSDVSEFEYFDDLKLDISSTYPKKVKAKIQETKETEEKKLKLKLTDFVVNGKLEKLKKLFETCDFEINSILDCEGNNLSHLSAMSGQKKILRFLLDQGGNLCALNKKSKSVYTCTDNREIKDYLKKYAKAFPDKFNYTKAEIPIILTAEEEEVKKQTYRRQMVEKSVHKQKREREHYLFSIYNSYNPNVEKIRELKEINEYEKISSRSHQECFICCSKLIGKIPFEFLDKKFCTCECFQAYKQSALE